VPPLTTQSKALAALLLVSCARSSQLPARALPPPPSSDETGGAGATAFFDAESRAIEWMSAADPRLALRLGAIAPKEVLDRIGTESVLAEDSTAQIRGGSLDLFSFRGRAGALEHAASLVAVAGNPLPEEAPVGSALLRPNLERELLVRLIEEEKARTAEEAKLGDASGDLVRAIVAMWAPPATPEDVPDRDVTRDYRRDVTAGGGMERVATAP